MHIKLYIYLILVCILPCLTPCFLHAQNTVAIESILDDKSNHYNTADLDTVKVSDDKSKSYKLGKYVNNRLSLRVGFAYPWRFNVDLNYTFLNIVEIGLYTGVDRFNAESDPDYLYIDGNGNTQAHGVMIHIPFVLLMGANLNIHILPLFVSSKDLRFDFYICNKFYTGFAFLPKDASYKSRFLPFHAETGLGFAYNFPKRWGLYIEGSYQYQDGFKADLISSYKDEQYFDNIGIFHGRIGFTFKLNK